jgi:hypothetical protein
MLSEKSFFSQADTNLGWEFAGSIIQIMISIVAAHRITIPETLLSCHQVDYDKVVNKKRPLAATLLFGLSSSPNSSSKSNLSMAGAFRVHS